MTQPRRVVPGATYLITRRCYQRTFRLRPSAATNPILAYCLAFALEKSGVVLHAACFMSNHHHLVVSDPRGVLPDFLRELHRSTAKAMNASQGQWENLWSAEPCNVLRLIDAHDIIDKVAYVAVNPVAAGLVAQPEDWPGLSVWTERSMPVSRPKAYFDEHGTAPAALVLQTALPLAREAADAPNRSAWWARRVRDAIAAKVAAAHRQTHSAGRGFLGRAGVLAQSFIKRAKSFEPRRALIPAVAAKDPRARKAMLRIHKAFRAAYREAVTQWRQGMREVVFPFGTWWMRVHHAARCAPEPGNFARAG